MNRAEVYTSKKKSFLALSGSIIFVLLGFWFLLEADSIAAKKSVNPIFITGVGIVAILFFGFGVFVLTKRLIKSEVALIIDINGINVNPKRSLTDFIKWEHITGFEEVKIQSTRIVIIQVKNPYHWLEKEAGVRRKLMQFNINNYNSPFNITASGLDINMEELKARLDRYLQEYRETA